MSVMHNHADVACNRLLSADTCSLAVLFVFNDEQTRAPISNGLLLSAISTHCPS